MLQVEKYCENMYECYVDRTVSRGERLTYPRSHVYVYSSQLIDKLINKKLSVHISVSRRA